MCSNKVFKSLVITHQVEVVKYFGWSVHLSQSDQDFIVNVFLVGFQVKVQPAGQIVQHLQSQSKAQSDTENTETLTFKSTTSF